ncbi:MAG TPA: hypothetical protein VKR99_03750, partial [Candidatus Eremiobacteraceae bacterium]|nr:hypothetical protein [Candidatus Eremiobacteraceae bacterium]
YGIDGGKPGLTRDAWLRFTTNPTLEPRAALRMLAGQFTLPLLIDPETMRESLQHYAVFDQTVGGNPFTFFAPKTGADIALGNEQSGVDAHVVFALGHDTQSGLPISGWDRMLVSQYAQGSAVVSAYRYDGHRPLGAVADTFWRQGLAASVTLGKLRVDLLSQDGNDSSADGAGLALQSSGGFIQTHWQLSPLWSSVVRYDNANFFNARNAAGTHAIIVSIIRKLWRNSRFTLEGVTSRPPAQRVLNAALLVAY